MDIERRSFEQPYEREVFESYLGSDLFIVALDNDRVIGYAIATVKGVIVSIAVLPEYRRRGVGKMMLEKLLLYVATGKIKLTLRVSNLGAHRFYEHMGFVREGVIRNYYENGEDAFIMVIRR